MPLTETEVKQIAHASADQVMARIRKREASSPSESSGPLGTVERGRQMATETEVKEQEINEVEPDKASLIHSEDGHQIGMVALWKDGHVTVCASEPGKETGTCYTSRKPDGNTLYYMALAWFSGMGHEVSGVPEE